VKVESGHGPMQTFERQVASGLERCTVPERRANFAIDKNMPVACLAAEPSSNIDHRPNHAVVTAPLEADRPERRESVGDAYAEAERGRRRASGQRVPPTALSSPQPFSPPERTDPGKVSDR
jgi:hypothetical protein